MSNATDDNSFLARWSRQKQQAKKRDNRPDVVPDAASREADAATGAPDIDITALPSIDDLTAESDISVFLQKGVPEALKRLALRRMWSLDPRIRDFIEVAENQWDFNAAGGIYGLFEELPPGTDMSTWVAQATQSAVGDPPDLAAQERLQTQASIEPPGLSQSRDGASKNAAVRHSPSGASEACQASAPLDHQAVRPGLESTGPPVTTAGSANNLAANARDPDPAVSSDPIKARPRHGGALPR